MDETDAGGGEESLERCGIGGEGAWNLGFGAEDGNQKEVVDYGEERMGGVIDVGYLCG